ncbi:hypothetical protein BG011_003185, partial [Mortierella polycephala]
DLEADLKKIADKFFHPESVHTKFLNAFVAGSQDLPLTQGGVPGLPRVGKRGLIKAQEAPTLLFFDLPGPGKTSRPLAAAEQTLADNPGVRHLPLFGVSGCGKTRTAIELLSRTWGLYFNAGAKDLGSSDMCTIIQAQSLHKDIYLTDNKESNTDRVRHLTFGLLYARLLILDYCLGIPGSSATFSCYRWMLLQVATSTFKDVFGSLFEVISRYFYEHVVSSLIVHVVQDMFDKVQNRLLDRAEPSTLPHFKFLL